MCTAWSLLYSLWSFKIFQYFTISWCKTFTARHMKRCYLQKKICETIPDFIKTILLLFYGIQELQCGI